MVTQQSVLFAHWSVAFHNAMCLIAEANLQLTRTSQGSLQPPSSDLAAITAGVEKAAALYDRLDQFDKEELPKLCRQGLELASVLRALSDSLALRPEDPVFEKWDEFADRAETLALSLDPEIAESAEEARRDASEGRTESLEDLRRRLQL